MLTPTDGPSREPIAPRRSIRANAAELVATHERVGAEMAVVGALLGALADQPGLELGAAVGGLDVAAARERVGVLKGELQTLHERLVEANRRARGSADSPHSKSSSVGGSPTARGGGVGRAPTPAPTHERFAAAAPHPPPAPAAVRRRRRGGMGVNGVICHAALSATVFFVTLVLGIVMTGAVRALYAGDAPTAIARAFDAAEALEAELFGTNAIARSRLRRSLSAAILGNNADRRAYTYTDYTYPYRSEGAGGSDGGSGGDDGVLIRFGAPSGDALVGRYEALRRSLEPEEARRERILLEHRHRQRQLYSHDDGDGPPYAAEGSGYVGYHRQPAHAQATTVGLPTEVHFAVGGGSADGGIPYRRMAAGPGAIAPRIRTQKSGGVSAAGDASAVAAVLLPPTTDEIARDGGFWLWRQQQQRQHRRAFFAAVVDRRSAAGCNTSAGAALEEEEEDPSPILFRSAACHVDSSWLLAADGGEDLAFAFAPFGHAADPFSFAHYLSEGRATKGGDGN